MEYDNKQCNQFVEDMEQAGFAVRHYNVRWHWQGPAVTCAHISDAMSETKVKCQSDSMGLGVVVYPLESGNLIFKD